MSAGTIYRAGLAEKWEADLTGAKRELWAAIAARLPPPTDYGLELFFLGKIAQGVKLEDLEIFIPKHFHRSGQDRRQHLDRRELAAGERA